MHKRMSIRIVDALAVDLSIIAKKRGLSINSLISEMAWDFVENWKKHYPARPSAQLHGAEEETP